ncbi:hypothetical protein ES703_59049 [subsurface metagenome]
MPIVSATIVPAEVSQEQWDAKFATTTEKVKDMGGGQTSDDLTEGAANKYDTGAPPASTDELAEGATNKYDTGVPPATQDDLPDGVTALQFLAIDQTKLAAVEENATADQDGPEMRDAIVALADLERKILVTAPISGEYAIISTQRNAAGEFAYKYNDVPEE